MLPERLERNMVVTGFILMFIGLAGAFISFVLLKILEILNIEEIFYVSQSLVSDIGLFFTVVISLGALLFIVEFILHKLGWASDPIDILKKP